MEYFESDMYFDDEVSQWLQRTYEHMPLYGSSYSALFPMWPLKSLSSWDGLGASPDDWLDTWEWIQGLGIIH